MAGIGNNLYPAIIQTYMPAFVRLEGCRVYFSLSIYNNKSDIKNVQIIISNQNNNQSALNLDKYPTGVMITNMQIDENIQNDYKYFVTIGNGDMDGGFELNQSYKVQLRFTGMKASEPDKNNGQVSASWLTNNQTYFSEWSTVCIIKGISKPQITLLGFDSTDLNTETIFTSEVTQIAGFLSFLGDDGNSDITNEEKEILKKYSISISKKTTGEIIYQSQDIYAINENEINYVINYQLEDGTMYILKLDYMTNNGYTESVKYLFSIIQTGIDKLNVDIISIMEEEYGRIKIDVKSLDGEMFLGNITIRRSSNESNFTVWEDVKTIPFNQGTALNFSWYDYTIKSGIWYRYGIQKRNSVGSRGIITYTRNPILAIFNDIFLTNKDLQVCIKYDPIISSYKKTISESRTETIGAKYPFIKRNGNIEYKQFPISGLITSYCDENGLFINRENIFKDMVDDYNNYNKSNNIDNHYDYIYEREFREKVENFLYSNTVKLFRSLTEGNILIKLMDISFTPNQTLGRMLYSFSATAYEIDECNLLNFDKYNIQNIGTYDTEIKYTSEVIGQLMNNISAGVNALDVLQERYNKQVLNNYINTAEYFKWIRLQFNDKPYMIKIETDGSLIPAAADDIYNSNYILGYIVEINNKPIIVNKNGYFELIDDDTIITSITFPIDTNITLDYIVRISEEEDMSKIARKIYYYTKIGQLFGTFNYKEYLYNKIHSKYYLDYKDYYQRIIAINSINLEFEPNTVVYVKDSFDDEFFRHVIGDTGTLYLKDNEATIINFYIGGIHMYENVDKNYLKRYQYINTGITVSSLDEIEVPIKNGCYSCNNKIYIFFRNNWYLFDDETKDVLCPVDGLVDYVYEMVKGEYGNET